MDEFDSRRDANQPKGRRNNRNFPVIVEDIISIDEKVFFPVEKYPRYNFVGPLMGPKGSILRELVLSTKTKISVLGKGSCKDRSKEKEAQKSDDPELAHFKEPLHVLVQAKGPRIEAHRRMANALKELNRFMIPQDSQQGPIEPANDGLNGVGRYSGSDLAPPQALQHEEAPQRRDEYSNVRDLPPLRDSYPDDRYYQTSRDEGERYRDPPRHQQNDYYSEERPRGRDGPSNGYSPTPPKRYRDEGW